MGRRKGIHLLLTAFLLSLALLRSSDALRPIRDRYSTVGSSAREQLFLMKDDNGLGSFSMWNITGTYRGRWSFVDGANKSPKFLEPGKSNGVSVLEIVSSPTKISGIHYLKGSVVFHDLLDNGDNLGVTQVGVEGVYIWPFRQIRLVASSSGTDGEPTQEEEYFLSNPYHLLGVFSSQVFPEQPRDMVLKRKKSAVAQQMERHCSIELTARVSRVSSTQNDDDQERYHLEGLVESLAVDDGGKCSSPISLNVTSLNIEAYYNKAVNYTLMVTFVSFIQVLLLIRQMEHSSTQSGAAKVSIYMVGQQAIMDAYFCLLHLTAGILVESLFNAFATAAFFKFVVFSIFEMRYLLAIWKANRSANYGEDWETMRRELSILYSRFYGVLLGGILLMYELHSFMRVLLFAAYSFWIPQIVNNVIKDTRKPLHPHYIIGMTLTRLAIPLYIFGCPSNFVRTEIDNTWCMCLVAFLGLQASVLLLQHYFGSRCFIPRQFLPEKYSYHRGLDNDANRAMDCVICMATIDIASRSNDYMVTPCDHCFHSGCLQRWMDIKMECPTCRRLLPPA